MDHACRTDLWQVRARTDGEFDASTPLANRFVHYWPYPYGASKSDESAAAEASATGQAMAGAALEENQRLLYVSLTRARDQIILVSRPGSNGGEPPLDWLNEAKAINTFWPGTVTRAIDGVEIVCVASDWLVTQTHAEPPEKVREAQRFYPLRTPAEHLPLWVQPSAAHDYRQRFGLPFEMLQTDVHRTWHHAEVHTGIIAARLLALNEARKVRRLAEILDKKFGQDLYFSCGMLALWTDYVRAGWRRRVSRHDRHKLPRDNFFMSQAVG